MFKEEPIATHWEGCEEVHPECKLAKLNRRIEMLQEILRITNKWTNEKLPEVGKPVLLMTTDGYVFIGYRRSDGEWIECKGCYGEYVVDFKWLPDGHPFSRFYGPVAYWKEIPLPPKDVLRHLKEHWHELLVVRDKTWLKESEDKD
jgi:hypothetical protein